MDFFSKPATRPTRRRSVRANKKAFKSSYQKRTGVTGKRYRKQTTRSNKAGRALGLWN